MTSLDGKHKLVGFADLGKGHDLMRTLSGTCYLNAGLWLIYLQKFILKIIFFVFYNFA